MDALRNFDAALVLAEAELICIINQEQDPEQPHYASLTDVPKELLIETLIALYLAAVALRDPALCDLLTVAAVIGKLQPGPMYH